MALGLLIYTVLQRPIHSEDQHSIQLKYYLSKNS